MPENTSKQRLDDQIALARRTIADLMERATATSGSGAEEAIANRINDQQDLLTKLMNEREAMG
ncbi:hypothetical protein [Bosea sp. BIWAKO-01]|uniref:hypothetical protein n=1 Tax=Bosea sp. BIWAKO-01 TaxID=506668 RepID=UPI000853709F|nr:hypothetical protein [Bosea sp. BIWAKO-01]GAU86163.1 hypothetical protein BIWAKO_06111 [Bosea sp. BIWAKO-01]